MDHYKLISDARKKNPALDEVKSSGSSRLDAKIDSVGVVRRNRKSKSTSRSRGGSDSDNSDSSSKGEKRRGRKHRHEYKKTRRSSS